MPRKDVCGLVVACALLAGATRPGPVQALPVSLSATSGVLLGGAKEFVYDGSYMLSELDWPILPAVYAGLKMDVGDTSGFLARAELKVGIPLPAGIMTDSDFLNLDGVKTHYSQSDGDIESIILASAQVGWGIPFWIPGVGTLSLEPFFSFEYIRLSWTAQNGYTQYPPELQAPFTPWSPSTPKVPMYGTAVMYTQNYLIPALGVKASIPLLDSLSMGASFLFSPFVWCFDKDSHYFRQYDFYDAMSNGILLEPSVWVTYNISAATALTLDVLYRHISQLTGNVAQVTTGYYTGGEQVTLYPNGGGASLDAFEISLSFAIGL